MTGYSSTTWLPVTAAVARLWAMEQRGRGDIRAAGKERQPMARRLQRRNRPTDSAGGPRAFP